MKTAARRRTAASLQSWRALDTAPDPGRLLSFLDELAANPVVAGSKQRSFELLGARPGSRVLDAGCGTGGDAVALAEEVLPDGEVVGVDLSEAAIAIASHRAGDRPGLRFRQADITALAFASASFDCARCDRTLLHVPKPELAVAELARVTRPGGAVVLTEATFQEPDRPSTGRRRAESTGRQDDWRVLAFLPFLLRRAGVEHIVVDHTEHVLELTPLMQEVLGTQSPRVELRVVHVAGTVARASV